VFIKDKEFHSVGAAVSVIIALLFGVSSTLELSGVVDIISLMFIVLSIRWIVFDLSYNYFTGRRWDYYGTTSTMDIFFGKYHLIVKSICLAVSICLTLYIK
jgi:hypothetical protein